jgi:pyruvate kinase
MKTKRTASCVLRRKRAIRESLIELTTLREAMVAECASVNAEFEAVHEGYRDSARNLLHYIALRRRDLRPLQLRLGILGLSSLGRTEAHVLATVDAVLEVLHRLEGRTWKRPKTAFPVTDFTSGRRLLIKHTDLLLGPAPEGRVVRIMVTMPSEAANDYNLVCDLLQQGMDCMRINCAHDEPAAWARMVGHLRQAEQALGRSCRIMMDLAGPKLRTGSIEKGLAVLRIRPTRNSHGVVTAPARIWFTSETCYHAPPSQATACLAVPDKWLAGLGHGECVTFTDARQSHRTFVIVDVTETGCWAESNKTAYIVPGTVLRHAGGSVKKQHREASIKELPTGDNGILLHQGDELILTRDLNPGQPATYDSGGLVLSPARIGCTIPEVFDDVRVGEAIYFDDGKIGGVLERVEPTEIHVRINQVRPQGASLRADKGINLPESNLKLVAMTEKDLEDLTFVAKHADLVALSFANSSNDVACLQEHLARMKSSIPAIVLKIETRRAFENLPGMLLTAMQSPSCGVMIARGDLAVECGFERLAEVQEEILWICEAAHIPVIWATQVLETLAKQGIPSRAEITDAAVAQRAECVMLNKGPQVVAAVRVLDGILHRMQGHQSKKQSMMRELRLAKGAYAG